MLITYLQDAYIVNKVFKETLQVYCSSQSQVLFSGSDDLGWNN